jgi:hypothetical protein
MCRVKYSLQRVSYPNGVGIMVLIQNKEKREAIEFLPYLDIRSRAQHPMVYVGVHLFDSWRKYSSSSVGLVYFFGEVNEAKGQRRGYLNKIIYL